MNFRLEKNTAGPTLTRFYVKDNSNAIVGTINVANEHADDLVKHWRTPQAATAKPAGGRSARSNQHAKKVDLSAERSTSASLGGRSAIVAALRKGPRLSKAALLRS